jgi:hypothetical protein
MRETGRGRPKADSSQCCAKATGRALRRHVERKVVRLVARAASENWEDEGFAYRAYQVFCLIAGITPEPPSDMRDMKLFYINWDLMRPFISGA